MGNNSSALGPTSAGRAASHGADAVYQGGNLAARVAGAEIRRGGREIYFAEVSSSDDLILSEECTFRDYRIIIQRIEYASRAEKTAPEKGRILRGVTADVLGSTAAE